MDVDGLIVADLEEELRAWMLRFNNLRALYEALPQLYQKLTSQSIQGTVEEGAVITGPVHVGANSIVKAGTSIIGPVIVGEHAIVGTGVELRDYTYIGNGASIFHGVAIERSLILNRSVVGVGAFVSNSLLGAQTRLGPHTVIGAEILSRQMEHALIGFTAVGANARIGAGALVERGVTVSDRAIVDNAVVLSSDVPSGGFVGRTR
jgi:NDP-sugar pyrophosphorylase family protein